MRRARRGPRRPPSTSRRVKLRPAAGVVAVREGGDGFEREARAELLVDRADRGVEPGVAAGAIFGQEVPLRVPAVPGAAGVDDVPLPVRGARLELRVLAHALARPDDGRRYLPRDVAVGVDVLQVGRPGLDTGDIVRAGEVPVIGRSLHAVWSELELLGFYLFVQAILEVKHQTVSYRPQVGKKGKLYKDPKPTDILIFIWRQLTR